ncbi:Crp/Fnr family transcriptional regulator [Tabrizicola sp.]|uniref:Crp/Fnr family transcriptional regulator n=1 Tax=Tabrizicola sp. TaxID=2005166 RepID=UPI002735296E|nr:Crp/Fnr family transcriptional regulator [Tabrizicola sp.]MDP3196007.1 Crp/Fnr family transcriptional regulator [Tabrizicola sp.]
MSWLQRFADLGQLPTPVGNDLVARSRVVHLPAGTRVFEAGQRAQNMLLLLQGSVRVQHGSDTGREVFLYRVHAGESCILTTACMLADEEYAAEGIAETEVEAVAIPRSVFDDLTARSVAFRTFVFRTYSRRIADLFALIDDIVFQRIDVRLAERLLDLEQNGIIQATHQALAVELGTAREVISRTLGEFQRRGWVETARGEISITQRAGLERLSRSVT